MYINSHIAGHRGNHIVDNARIGAIVFFYNTETVEPGAGYPPSSRPRRRRHRRFHNFKHPFTKVGLNNISRNKLESRVIKPLLGDMFYLLYHCATIFIHPRFSIVANRSTFFTNGVNDDRHRVRATGRGLKKCHSNRLIK